LERIAHGAQVARELHTWQKALEQHWSKIHFGRVQVQNKGELCNFEAQVYIGDLDPDFIAVQIYADPLDRHDAMCQSLTRGEELPGTVNGYLYRGAVPATRALPNISQFALYRHFSGTGSAGI